MVAQPGGTIIEPPVVPDDGAKMGWYNQDADAANMTATRARHHVLHAERGRYETMGSPSVLLFGESASGSAATAFSLSQAMQKARASEADVSALTAAIGRRDEAGVNHLELLLVGLDDKEHPPASLGVPGPVTVEMVRRAIELLRQGREKTAKARDEQASARRDLVRTVAASAAVLAGVLGAVAGALLTWALR